MEVRKYLTHARGDSRHPPQLWPSTHRRPACRGQRSSRGTVPPVTTYSGDVLVGGPPQTRVLPDLSITKIAVGPMSNNAYLLRCSSTGHQMLIDAADEPQRLLELIGDGGLWAVVTTHRHADHWQALQRVAVRSTALCLAGRLDAEHLPVVADVALDHGDEVQVGSCVLRVIHLIGHTPGSIALVYDDPQGSSHLFSGDSLFPGGPGRTTNPTDFTSLMDGLQTRVFDVMSDETWVYPGHGADTVLGLERPHLDEWRARGW